MIERARKEVGKALRSARRPVVLCSFGKDSMLLLFLAREVKPDIPVLWLRSDLTAAQRAFAEKVIADWKLETYGYAPADRYYVRAEGGMTLVNEYSVGGMRLPVLVDVRPSPARCGLELSRERTRNFAYPWDVTLVGWKDTDGHPVAGASHAFPRDGARFGPTRFRAPLRDWTDGEVLDACRALGVPVNEPRYYGYYSQDPDNLEACTHCMLPAGSDRVYCPKVSDYVPAVPWDEAGALAAFRQRFGIKE